MRRVVGRRVGRMQRLGLAATLMAVSCVAVAPGAMASPGLPDRDRHPFVGMVVEDLGDGYVDPYCHITLISPTEAVTAHHCAPTGSEVLFTLDNPVVVPAQIHSGTVRVGGWDFENFYVDIAIVDLHEPIDLPRYAQVALEPVTYGPGTILDFVTYVGAKQSGLVTPIVVPGIGFLPKATDVQPEPAHVEFDRNLIRTTPKPGAGGYETAETINTTNPTCFGNSGSPIFLKGTDLMTGVLSYGTRYACVGGGNAYFARTDSELASAILDGTIVEPPPPPPPPPTVYPRLATDNECRARSGSLRGSAQEAPIRREQCHRRHSNGSFGELITVTEMDPHLASPRGTLERHPD